jgi:hypothetical protein
MPRKMKGRGKFKDFLGKANNFLKKSQILSKLGSAYSKYGGMAGLPYAQQVGMASDAASTAGYGRRRKRRVGSGLYAAGGKMRRGRGLKLAGGAHHMIGARRPMTW